MARIRTVKPDFFRNAKVSRCSIPARLLDIAIWTEADDAGRVLASAKYLAGTLFSLDEDVTPKKVEVWLNELERAGRIHLYEIDGVRYLQVHDWEHQKISKPQPPKYPAPTNGFLLQVVGDSGSSSGNDSRNGSGNDPGPIPVGKGREGKGKESKAPPEASDKPPQSRNESYSNRLASMLVSEFGVQFEPRDTLHESTRDLLKHALNHKPKPEHRDVTMGLIRDYVQAVHGWKLNGKAAAHTAGLVGIHGPMAVLEGYGQALQWGAGIPDEHANDPLSLSKYVAAVLSKTKAAAR